MGTDPRHRFEFAVSAPTTIESMASWTDEIRRIESMGFTTVVVADHFTDGYELEPMIALTAAAGATSTLRLQTGVLCNDYRHPVLTARMAASLDLVSEGRLTLGIGAGWMTSDYEAAGIVQDRPGVRVARLAESVEILAGLFSGQPYAFSGEHYQVDLDLLPRCVQSPLPIFIGGGSPKVLGVGGRHADVVGVLASLGKGELGNHAIVDQTHERVAEKIGWVREAATRAGRDSGDIRIEMNHWLVRITKTLAEADEFLAKISSKIGVPVDLLQRSPAVMVGTVDQLVDTLGQQREELGISCLQLDAGFAPADIAPFEPLVAALAGT